MAKVRLNNSMRGNLLRTARTALEEKYAKQENVLYNEVFVMLQKMLKSKYTPNEFKVLTKFGLMTKTKYIGVKRAFGGSIGAEYFKAKDDAFVYLQTHTVHALDKEQTMVFEKYQNFIDAKNQDIRNKMKDYELLIKNSKYLDEIEEVWPKAAEIRERIAPTTAVVKVVTEDVIHRIQSYGI